MSYKRLFEIVSAPWADISRIQAIANNCSKENAKQIRDFITDKVHKQNLELPSSKAKVVPTRLVMEHLGLDINFIQEMAIREQEFENLMKKGYNNASISGSKN